MDYGEPFFLNCGVDCICRNRWVGLGTCTHNWNQRQDLQARPPGGKSCCTGNRHGEGYDSQIVPTCRHSHDLWSLSGTTPFPVQSNRPSIVPESGSHRNKYDNHVRYLAKTYAFSRASPCVLNRKYPYLSRLIVAIKERVRVLFEHSLGYHLGVVLWPSLSRFSLDNAFAQWILKRK